MLGLRTFFVAPEEDPWSATYDVHLGREHYRLRVLDGRLTELTRTAPDSPPDATLTCTDHMTMNALAGQVETLDALMERGDVAISGDADAVRRLINAVQKSQPTPAA